MRRTAFCLCLAGLPLLGYVAALAGGPLAGEGPRLSVNRAHKGARLHSAARTAAPAPRITTVEVVGVDDAAIVYRDRDGRVLFATDPLSNKTVVVRGVTLPVVTVRETARVPTRPVVVQPDATGPGKAGPPARQHLPKECEPAASPLSASGMSAARARCFVALEGPRLAALR